MYVYMNGKRLIYFYCRKRFKKKNLLSEDVEIFCFWGFFILLRPYLWHMEFPRLGVQSEQKLLPADTTATAMLDLSHVCNLHHSS